MCLRDCKIGRLLMQQEDVVVRVERRFGRRSRTEVRSRASGFCGEDLGAILSRARRSPVLEQGMKDCGALVILENVNVWIDVNVLLDTFDNE
jgi:hypothetical protein